MTKGSTLYFQFFDAFLDVSSTSMVKFSRMAALYIVAIASTCPWLIVLNVRCQ